MDAFRTIFPPQRAEVKISHADRLLLIGSCFTEHIGAKLTERKFPTLVNPFGIVYNPASMAACLHRLMVDNQPFMPDELFENAGLWHSWEHHSRFSRPQRDETLASINQAYEAAAEHLSGATRLLITLGTADVHFLLENGKIVANNHKMPAALFGQKRLSVEEVTETLAKVLEKLREKNPGLAVVLSVSPVRHLRSGFVESQRSKATLVLACEALCRQAPQTYYFPAYELLMDDLRDYRFYAADMIHPSDVAVEYIWEYFSNMFFDEKTRQWNASIEKILQGMRHRPFNPDTEQHRAFEAAQQEAIRKFEAETGLSMSE